MEFKIEWLTQEFTADEKAQIHNVKFEIKFEKIGTKVGEGSSVEVLINYTINQNNFPQIKVFTQKYSGRSEEVYKNILENSDIQNKENFINQWNIARYEYTKKQIKKITNNEDIVLDRKVGELLSKQFYFKNITAKDFAKKAKKDVGNIYKEQRGVRNISIEQAINYSKVLECDPVDLLFPELKCEIWGLVDPVSHTELERDYIPGEIWMNGDFNKEIVVVPRDIYKTNIRAIRINSENSPYKNNVIFYYKNITKTEHNGKPVIIGIDVLDAYEEKELRYFYGIFENYRGQINLINTDPFAKKKLILENINTNNILFISPVVATVDINLTKKNNKNKSSILKTDIQNKLFELEKQLKTTKTLLTTAKAKIQNKKENSKALEQLKRFENLYNETFDMFVEEINKVKNPNKISEPVFKFDKKLNELEIETIKLGKIA